MKMKEDILQRLDLTLGARNSISVKGKENLANLSGSIAMIEEVMKILHGANITQPESKE